MKRTKRKVAIAEPRPKRFWPLNERRHISNASVVASGRLGAGAIARMRSKSFSTPMICVTSTTVSTGARSGTVTRRNTCHSVPPSVRAASSTSRGMAASPAAMITIAKPACTHRKANMIEGVISFSPSQLKPVNGAANVTESTLTRYCWPDSTSSKTKLPSASVVVFATVSPPESTSATVTPPRPDSPDSTSPGVPPPGLKSRHTSPEIPPSTGSGGAASGASSGTSWRGPRSARS